MEHAAHTPSPGRRRILWGATILALGLAIACYVYGIEHRDHIAQAMTWLLVLACPLMHLFGHGGHRHGGGSRSE